MAASMAPTTESSPLAGGKRRSSSPDLDEPTKRQKSDSPVVSKCSFTNQFFMDMAATIARNFPVSNFAEAHSCSAREVLEALAAVVLSPLREPQPWHGAESVSDYAQILIGDWRGRTQQESSDGTLSRPIIISDPSCCSSPTQPSGSESSLGSQNSVSSSSRIKRTSEDFSSPSMPEKDVTRSKECPGVKEVKTAVDEKPVRPSKEPADGRREVRVDIYGTCIPVDKWADGHHIPAPPKIRRDALSDAEFYKMLAEGWFD